MLKKLYKNIIENNNYKKKMQYIYIKLQKKILIFVSKPTFHKKKYISNKNWKFSNIKKRQTVGPFGVFFKKYLLI